MPLGGMALAAVLCACGAEGEARTVEAAAALAPREVTITARDYGFEAPATLPAGLTAIRMVNDGPELHHVQLVRLEAGKTVEDVRRFAEKPGPFPAWMHFVGGPNASVPGKSSVGAVELTPGEYALVCIIPSPDGVPHLMKGMIQPLRVTAPEGPDAALAADLDMTLSDYAFELSGELTAGRRTVQVRNAARQPHEVILVRLAPGKRAQDMLQWMHSPNGPPPGEPIGGTTVMSTNQVNYVTADFTAGEYALLCMVPDAADGKPHVAHGMVREITVR
jgi:uncharacterized cupredoxin-like copper-binding protein